MMAPALFLIAAFSLTGPFAALELAVAGQPAGSRTTERPQAHLVSADPGTASAGEVCVRGRLTDEGIECQAMRGADGRLYTLAGAPASLEPGAEACFCGTVAELSTCMQGTTLAVTRIAPTQDCP